MTSPPAVIDNLVVVGSSIDDNSRVDMPAGVVRAFDARTGALRWAWDPIPPNEAEPAADPAKRWRTGAANAWSILAVDPAAASRLRADRQREPRLLRRPASR